MPHSHSRSYPCKYSWITDTLANPSTTPPATEYSSSSDSSIEPSESEAPDDNLDDEPNVNPVHDVEMSSTHEPDEGDVRMSSPPTLENGADLEEMVDSGGQMVFVERYPNRNAGQPIRDVEQTDLPPEYQTYPDVGALADPENFEVAKLLMESGVSGRFRNRYLTLKRLPHGPDWFVKTYDCKGVRGTETAECWMRDSLAVIKRLIIDRILGKKMHWAPERHYTDRSRKCRRRGELWTADWLWRLQEEIGDEFASLVSVIVSSDETRLTNFAGDKKAHPVYLTIGNIPKHLRRRISSRATVLIGYLPVPKLDCEPNADLKRGIKRDLFHRCIQDMLAPLTKACKDGGAEVPCADKKIRRIYPVLAAYIADYPEQCKVACVKHTHCPLCITLPKTRGDPGDSGLRDRARTMKVLNTQDKKGSGWFAQYGLLPTRPFWATHPYVDLGSFLTPDLLHQVHKGVMKDHLIKWATSILGKSTVDERYTSMPEVHGIRHFKNGISTVSQWTGRELKEMVKVLLPVLSDSDPAVVRAAHALMDFMYLAHGTSLSDEDLDAMDDAIRTFHDHKAVFQELGAVTTDKGFHGIPKLHMISHYVHLIRELGTPDGYNTETSERLHIDFAKMGYRASNKVNATKQMALYIQRLEAIAMHAAYLDEQQQLGGIEDTEDEVEENWWDAWYNEEEEADQEFELLEQEGTQQPMPELQAEDEDTQASVYAAEWDKEKDGLSYPCPEVVVAKIPTVKNVSADYMIRHHGATSIERSLQTYLGRAVPEYRHLDLGDSDEYRFNTWSRFRLLHPPPPFNLSEGAHCDVVRAQPEKIDKYGRTSKPARFDTVLVLTRDSAQGIHRYRPARVHVIFELPNQIRHVYPAPLAYVEFFNYCSDTPREPTALFTTSHSKNGDGTRATSVVPLSSIRMTCHLAPKYTAAADDNYLMARSDTLTLYSKFFFNIFSSYFIYNLMRHWGQDGMWRSDPEPNQPRHTGEDELDELEADSQEIEEEWEEEESEEERWGEDEGEEDDDENDDDDDDEEDVARYITHTRSPLRPQTVRLPRGLGTRGGRAQGMSRTGGRAGASAAPAPRSH
ncbi:hypothetical protein FRC11_014812 [Ceratobasidium sp. 423]|nr:hypothetical protein FRC11_014812 [Ceratobasidium sp. 423]